jgi:hypothetical protein
MESVVEILRNFESLGENCEFGFLLEAYEIGEGSLFRWAFVNDFAKMAQAIDRKMTGSFAFDAMRPYSATMIVDESTNIAWHTKMRIAVADDQFSFVESEDERRAIHATELSKFEYLRDKFFRSLAEEQKIYVIKCNIGITDAEIDLVTAALQKHGRPTLFHVKRADRTVPAGTVSRIGANHFVGYIDRFSDYDEANDISKACWTELCTNVWEMRQSREEYRPGKGEYQISVAPITLPEGFDEVEYYAANPGVKEAGMGAAEHYLKFGWKEGRPIRP